MRASHIGSQPSSRQAFRNERRRETVGCVLTIPTCSWFRGGLDPGRQRYCRNWQAAGFRSLLRVARQIIEEQVQSGGTALPWRDREAYTLLMLERSIGSYLAHTPASRPMFSDRGIPDTLCYARLIGLSDEGFILDACRQYRYAPLVFLAPPWRD